MSSTKPAPAPAPTPNGSRRVYGGVDATERKARRRESLLEAALDVIATHGTAGLTVRGVCGHAGLTDRYFYENFRDRDDLLCALADDLFSQATAALTHAITGAPQNTAVRVQAAIRTGVAWICTDPRRGRFLSELQTTASLQSNRTQAIRFLAAIMADQARDLLGGEAPSERGAEMASLTLVSGALELIATWLRGDLDANQEQLTHFLIAMILTTGDLSVALDRVAHSVSATTN